MDFLSFKSKVISTIFTHLNKELEAISLAAKNAHLAATDDQSIAETQYDTLAIEAGYLAEGQSKRALTLKKEIQQMAHINLSIDDKVKIGSLVQLEQDQSNHHWFFIAPAAAGYHCIIDNQSITVITPSSPVAKALIGNQVLDEVQISTTSILRTDEITTIK